MCSWCAGSALRQVSPPEAVNACGALVSFG